MTRLLALSRSIDRASTALGSAVSIAVLVMVLVGAFNAVASLCRHPDAFSLAIGMSGTYDLSRFLHGHFDQDFYFSSPLHFLPGLEGPLLSKLRERLILLPSGEGEYEDIGESWRMAAVLGDKSIPNRVDPWGADYRHDWDTWRAMLPQYLAEYA